MGYMLAKESKDRVEIAIYYLSKKMLNYETRYTPLEKACLALVWATRKLRHYLLAHSVILVLTSSKLFGQVELLFSWT